MEYCPEAHAAASSARGAVLFLSDPLIRRLLSPPPISCKDKAFKSRQMTSVVAISQHVDLRCSSCGVRSLSRKRSRVPKLLAAFETLSPILDCTS